MLERSGPMAKPMYNFNAVRFQNVNLTIAGKNLLRDISCTLNMRGKTVVMGPNGAGKSLFLRLLAGLLKPTSGQITGGIASTATDTVSCLSMVFQNPVLLRRSAFANIAYVLHRQKFSRVQLSEKVTDALKTARLETRAQIPARRLSGGEQQRLALARALVVEPAALLLDEATASLDPASTHIVERMADEAAQNGTKVIFVTHDVKQAKRVADDVLFIDSGRIMAHKSAKDFFKDPGSDEAQAYLDGRVPEPNYRSKKFGH